MNTPQLPPPYPLCWPEGRPRTEKSKRRQSRFRVEYSAAVRDLSTTLRILGKPAQVTSDVVGLLADAPADPGVAVWLAMPSGLRCICCDEYQSVRENVRAIGLTLDALRQVENYGTTMLDQVLGHSVPSLPQSASASRDWFAGCSTRAEIETRYRELAMEQHPDRGGEPGTMAEINEAKALAMQAVSE